MSSASNWSYLCRSADYISQISNALCCVSLVFLSLSLSPFLSLSLSFSLSLITNYVDYNDEDIDEMNTDLTFILFIVEIWNVVTF